MIIQYTKNFASLTFSILLTLFFFVAEDVAEASTIADAAEISRFKPEPSSTDLMFLGDYKFRRRNPLQIGARLLNLRQYLWMIGNSRAEAFISYVFDGQKDQTLGMKAGPSLKSTQYFFPCHAENGRYVIGWLPADVKQRQCSNPGFTHSFGTNVRNLTKEVFSQEIFVANKTISYFLKAQSSLNQNPIYRYCSVAAKGRGWWFRFGDFENPCNEAFQECFKTGPKQNCKAVGIGDWFAREEELLVVIACANNRLYKAKGNGLQIGLRLISDLAQQAKSDNSTVCSLNVIKPNSIIVYPATEKATIFHSNDNGGSLSVDVLLGSVLIRSYKNSEGILVESGNKYTYPQETIDKINTLQISQSPEISSFFDSENWPSETRNDLRYFQTPEIKPPSRINIPRTFIELFINNIIRGVIDGSQTSEGNNTTTEDSNQQQPNTDDILQ